MLQLIAVATLALPAAPPPIHPATAAFAQDDEEPAPKPTKEEIERSLTALKDAFAQETTDLIVGALQNWESEPAEEIVEELVDVGLAHDEQPVVLGTIEALGYLEHADALEALHKYLKRNAKRLRAHERGEVHMLPPLLLAISRHANEESIDYLVDDMFREPTREVVRARLLGLGNIRAERSVEELCDLMRKIDRRKVQPYANDFRLALVVLTGVDRGTDLDRWVKWWNENKKTLEVPEKPPQMPEELQTRWDRYWGLQRQYQRQKRRGERGDDGDRGA